jgi:ketosteroid isomerase-like protein
MKAFALAATVCGVLLAPPVLAADDAMAPVHQFVDALNAGDAKTAAKAYIPAPSIIDEFPPHYWTSFEDWLRDFGTDTKKNGVSDVHVALEAPTTSTVGAVQAYEVIPNVITAKVGGKPTKEKGIFTFALLKTYDGWRIAGWSWTKQ